MLRHAKLYTVFNLLGVLFFLVLAVIKYTDVSPWLYLEAPSISALACHNKPQHQLIYQHGKYWVLSNIVNAKLGAESNCRSHVTLTYQGSYKELYKLIELHNNLLIGVRTSFAVYVATQDQITRLLNILNYAQKCASYDTRLFSYHLYFPFANSINYLPKWDLELLKTRVDCAKLKLELYMLNNDPQVEAKVDEATRIVGANIAQLEAGTLFLLPTATDSFPTNRLLSNLMFQLGEIPSCGLKAVLQKTVIRLPLIPVKYEEPNIINAHIDQLDLRKLIKRNSTSRQFLLNDFNSQWLNVEHSHACFGEVTCAQVLQEYPLSILGFSSLPLLYENQNLTLAESEQLRVKGLCLQDYHFFNTRANFVLQRVASFEVASCNALSSINPSFLQQYSVMFEKPIEKVDLQYL